MAEHLKVVWSSPAAADLEGIINYILADNGIAAATSVHKRIMGGIETLTSFVRRCRIVPELSDMGIMDFRKLIVSPYRVFFRVHDNRIVLAGIFDARRNLADILIERALSLPE